MKRFVFLMFTLCLSAAFLMTSCKDPEPEPTPSPNDQVLTKDGIYLSIYAFNNGIVSKMDYTLIDNQSSDLIQNWIRNLQNNEDATALLYTIDSSLNTLNRTQFPKSLSSLHMVNFTDGIDNASVYFSNSQWGTHYANRNEYQTALKNRLRNGTFHGLSMSAFGVGVQSASIDPVVFNSTIQDISSSDDKARVLANFASVNQEFEQIANSISSTTTVTDVTFSFTCGGSDRIAFVFDGAATPALSTCKIEATLNANNTLSDIEYTGLTSSSAATITGQHVNGSIFSFTFKNLRTTNNETPSTYDVRLFKESLGLGGNTYAQDVEFNPQSQTYTQTQTKTAGIILVLDVSSSLGSNFVNVQEAACNFVQILADSQKKQH